jgi:thiamine-monophosphate kinase
MTTPAYFGEDEFLALLRERVATLPPRPEIALGIGDDAAVLRRIANAIVTTDMLLDGIDFVVAECGAERAGRKALTKNLSDLAAMGALPIAAFVSVALPPATTREFASRFLDGLCAAAREFECAIAGGDTKRSPRGLVVNVTLIGAPAHDHILTRSGGRPGDVLVVSGPLGGSILGHHLDFTPRLAAGAAFARRGATAVIDLSDGLARDLPLLAAASGCGAELDAASIPIAAAAHELARSSGRSALDHALDDGEDYELLVALPHEVLAAITSEPSLAGTTIIGRLVADPGVTLVRDGHREPLARGGFRHHFEGGDRER